MLIFYKIWIVKFCCVNMFFEKKFLEIKNIKIILKNYIKNIFREKLNFQFYILIIIKL